jgi:predicted nucleotidyltransferase
MRLAAGLTQRQLAQLTGVAQSNISAYELGRRHASAAMTQRLVAAMTRPSQLLARHRDQALDVIARHGGLEPRLFGSAARGQDTVLSDLDILVRPAPGAGLKFMAMGQALRDLLGVHVDVVSEGGLRGKHRAAIDQAVPL